MVVEHQRQLRDLLAGLEVVADLVIRKLKFLDGAVDQLEGNDRDDIRAELDARFALMSAEIRRLFEILEPALKLSRVDA